MITSRRKITQQEPVISFSSPAIQRAKSRQRRRTLIVTAGRIILFVCLISFWQFASGRLVNPLFISSPSDIVQRLWQWIGDGTLWLQTSVTLEEVLLGLLYGTSAGVVAGVILGMLPTVAQIFDPFLVMLNSIPKVAIAPVFILWFGIAIEMKVILAALTVFFLVFFNTLSGVRDVDQNLINAVTLMGAKRRHIILKVIFPSAIGYILTGFRIAIPYALIGAVIGELVAASSGLGYQIMTSSSEFDAAGVFAALLVLTVISALLNAVVNFIYRLASRWKAGTTTRR